MEATGYVCLSSRFVLVEAGLLAGCVGGPVVFAPIRQHVQFRLFITRMYEIPAVCLLVLLRLK